MNGEDGTEEGAGGSWPPHDPQTAAVEPGASLDEPRPRRPWDLFIRPGRFFDAFAQRGPGSGATFLAFWLVGFIAVLDRVEMREALGKPQPVAQGSWWMLLGAALVGGLVQGGVLYVVAGWWYGKRLRWSRAEAVDDTVARRVYAFSSLVLALPALGGWLVCAALFDTPAAYMADGGPTGTLFALGVMVMTAWSVVTSWRGISTVFRPEPWRAGTWFLVLPLGVYGTCLSGFAGVGAWQALYPSARTSSPSHHASRTMTFDYPGNWSIEVMDPDHDPQRSVRVTASQDACVKLQLYPSATALEDEVAATLASLSPKFERVAAERRPFQRWGDMRGHGVEVAVTIGGEAYTLRLFASRADSGLTFEVLELWRDEDDRQLAHGFALVRNTLVLTGALPRSASEVDVAALVRELEASGGAEGAAAAGARERLEALASEEVSIEQGLELLAAAGRAAQRKESELALDLVESTGASPDVAFVPALVAGFAGYPSGAREAALRMLASIEEREAAVALVSLLQTHAVGGGLRSFPTGTLDDEPRHADVLFPDLLGHADDPALGWGVHTLLLRYLEEGLMDAADVAAHVDGLLRRYRDREEELRAAERDGDDGWIWSEPYQEDRGWACLVLDILGYLEDPASAETLEGALERRDPRLVHFALRSLLRRGREVDDRHVAAVARSHEVRTMLVDFLAERGELARIPDESRSQEALATSDLVAWLTYPTELGRPPAHIELMDVVTDGTGDDAVDFYVFRFLAVEDDEVPGKEWMAGIAGGFVRKDAPTTQGSGETFSRFDAWESRSAAEHVAVIREQIAARVEATGASTGAVPGENASR